MRGTRATLAALKGCATDVTARSISTSAVAQAFRPAHSVNSCSNSPPKIASTPIDRSHSAFNGAYTPYAHNRAAGLMRRTFAITGAASRVAVHRQMKGDQIRRRQYRRVDLFLRGID
jgi:hypothetical protein